MEPKKFTYKDRTEYLLDGLLHREDGPAVEWTSGKKEWYQHGRFHREDGPALETPVEYKSWWVNGLRHREDGPAIEYANGSYYWYINGVDLTEEINIWISDTGFNKDYNNWTNEEKLLFKLMWF